MWKVNTYILTDLGSVKRGRSRHRPRDDNSLYGGEYPFVQTGDVKSANFYLTKYSQTYNEKGLQQSKMWGKGTLCITIAANIAETAILGIDACFPDSIVGFTPYEDKADVRYIKYYFDMFKKQMQVMSLGATQDNFSVEKMLKVKFIVPSLPVQRKIADILSNYDELIENNNHRIELLEQAAQQLYKEWFVRFRFPGFEAAHFTKGIPDGWEVKKLSEIAKIQMGQSPKSKFYNENDEGLPFHQGVSDFNNRYPTHITYCTEEKRVANNGDILLSVRAPVGRINIANRKLVIGRGLCSISSKTNNQCYLYYLLNNHFHKEDIIGNGSIFSSVSKDELFRVKLLLPPKYLIGKYESIVTYIDSQILRLNTENQNLIKQRGLILPRLMSGKLDIYRISEVTD